MRPKLDEGLDWITASEWVAGFSCVLEFPWFEVVFRAGRRRACRRASRRARRRARRRANAPVVGRGAWGWAGQGSWLGCAGVALGELRCEEFEELLTGSFCGLAWLRVARSGCVRFGISASEWAGGFSSALEWFGSACSSSYVTFGRCERLSGTPSGTPWGTRPGCWARRKSLASCTLSSTLLGKRSSCWARRALGTLSAVGQAPRLLGAVAFKA